MTTITKQLADALRDAILCVDPHQNPETFKCARDALAAYDARLSRMAMDYRVTTEWDAFDATTPREAAIEVWEAIRFSPGPVFTVYGRDGSVTDVDLSDETDEGVQA